MNIALPSTQRFKESFSCEPAVGELSKNYGNFLEIIDYTLERINQHSDAISCATFVTARVHTITLLAYITTHNPTTLIRSVAAATQDLN